VAKTQPAKLAAFEGLYATEERTPLYLFGWPDDAQKKVHYGLAVPGMLSFLVHRDFNRPVPGFDRLAEAWGQPPVWISFQSYHVMVACGMLMASLALLALYLRWRGTLWNQRWLLWAFVFAVIPGFVANELGWVAAEVGRQPWIVYPVNVEGTAVGGLKTADAVSETVTAGEIVGSMAMFGFLYALLFVLWLLILNHKIQHGPDPIEPEPELTTAEDYLDAASRRPSHEDSMTEPKGAPAV
jgi:cytochrome d ubiquinol oxidase subunit I